MSLEQSKCLLGPLAGIQVSLAGNPNTKMIIRCTVCRGFTLWSRFFAEHKQAWRQLRKILMKLKNMLSMKLKNMLSTWRNNLATQEEEENQ
jgi:hypothetical protein